MVIIAQNFEPEKVHSLCNNEDISPRIVILTTVIPSTWKIKIKGIVV
jgi:hypothetical protein